MGGSVLRQPTAAVPELVWYGFGATSPKPLHGDACHYSGRVVGALRLAPHGCASHLFMDPSRSAAGSGLRGSLGQLQGARGWGGTYWFIGAPLAEVVQRV